MDAGEFALSDREFNRVKARVYAEAGISLSAAKRTLVVSRLSKLVRALGLPTIDAYLDHLERAGSAAQAQDFINALTTNLTRFWREEHHFEHLATHVGGLLQRARPAAAGRPRLRIWSAGCSTGQEPYTIALSLLAAHPDLRRWDFRILATDIDTSVLARAAGGIYPESELNGLSAGRVRLFERPGDGTIRIPAAAREVVAFKPLNLMAAWPMKGPFDAIFCRNVAIYFDKPTQGALFGRLGGMLAPGGFLYIGHSENLGTGSTGVRPVGKTIYQSAPALRARAAA
ncbi:MAG: protein-glutamate O-methyltransferase CheR [Thiobacillus sp.]|uniref:CheR family methyltransferase n=1 Tax=Thiobacillus sp. TaxID=924 RepID=UPI0028942FA2|nr:protein-glutamate O-methyltransferase CheR [Thiobacillus sp.]MDT3707323.1 protein-glutamate O-methyltransferase CheR [Thiobacillus sp.]